MHGAQAGVVELAVFLAKEADGPFQHEAVNIGVLLDEARDFSDVFDRRRCQSRDLVATVLIGVQDRVEVGHASLPKYQSADEE
eukprot:1977491-Rhodomonas_salina.1